MRKNEAFRESTEHGLIALAEQRVKNETQAETIDKLHSIITKLEADNAALTARVKELEADVKREAQSSTHNAQDCLDEQLRAEALEAKLAAAELALETKSAANEALSKSVVESIDTEKRLREALTEIASFTETTDLLWWQQRARAALL